MKNRTKSNEAMSNVDIKMASDHSVGITKTKPPSQEELNTVLVHPAIRDILEHTEMF